MKRMLPMLLCLALLLCAALAEQGAAAPVGYKELMDDLLAVWTLENSPEEADAGYKLLLARSMVKQDLEELDDPIADAVADIWESTYLDPAFKVLISGQDDPASLPASGRHAFVVLGFKLENGEMADELKARCEAAAEAASAFPDSILVCSGGATGENNPLSCTEAGLMKQYLSETCGIDPARIFTDERAMDTADNAVNTFAILKEHGIEQFTLVTSSYHQKRAAALYLTLAAITRLKDGYSLSLAGNFSAYVETDERTVSMDARIAARQLTGMLGALAPKKAE